jgi:DNA-binding transcriptional LysR family regulator
MDRLAAMKVFVAVAEAESFAMAAHRLGISPPQATRALRLLEERIGTRLLQRTTRVVRLSQAGERFLADCRRILTEVDEAEASAAGSHADPVGVLAITAPVMFGRLHVAPVVLDFLERHPAIDVRLLLVDRVVDLIDEGFDVAVRIAHLPDSSLAAVRVGAVRRVVCASPAYLERHGVPRHPADITRHTVVTFGAAEQSQDWAFRLGARTERVQPRSRLIVNAADVAVAAAIAGRGLTRVLTYQASGEVRAGRLVKVLTDFEPAPLPIHLVHAGGRRVSARARAFVDFAVDRLRRTALD